MKSSPTCNPGDVVYSIISADGGLARAYSQLGEYGLTGDVFNTGDVGPWLVLGVVEKPARDIGYYPNWFAYVLGRQFMGWVPVSSLA